jgi:hypothetical protein
MGGYSNPFDKPLDSEVGEHQQAHAATTQASPIGNPFDEPLLSEKAEAQAKANAAANPEDAASQTRQMAVAGLTGMPTPNMSEADKASFEQGKAAGAISVPVVAGAVASAPLLGAVGSHLTTIKNIISLAEKAGIGAIGYKEARELYKEFAGESKK